MMSSGDCFYARLLFDTIASTRSGCFLLIVSYLYEFIVGYVGET